MIRSSIDIGTNSVLLLVAEFQNGRLRVLKEEQSVPRLGKGVDSARTLHPDSMQRVLEVLTRYKELLDQNYPDISDDTIVTATSAVRDSANREEFLGKIKEETGWEVRLLSGDEEAETTFRGAVSVLKPCKSDFVRVVLDIGGGSTEIAAGSDTELKQAVSVDMGSVRFSEKFLKSDPPLPAEMDAARKEIQNLLEGVKLNGIMNRYSGRIEAVGVAGTVTSIAAIEIGLDQYEAEKINGFVLTKNRLGYFIDKFSKADSNQIEKEYPVFLAGRGDVILAGLLILDEFLDWCGVTEITVSTGGIRHGVLLG